MVKKPAIRATSSYTNHRLLKPRIVFSGHVGLLAVRVPTYLVARIWQFLTPVTNYKMLMSTEIAILIGAVLATAGWIYTGRRARGLAKKQHTINVILRANFSAKFLAKRQNIAPHVKAKKCPEALLDGSDEQLRRDFRDILNHYEFVCAGLRNGDFDEKLIKDSERGTYVSLYECCERYIWRLRDNRDRLTIYEHLEWVHRRWVIKPPNALIRFYERVRCKPIYGKMPNGNQEST